MIEQSIVDYIQRNPQNHTEQFKKYNFQKNLKSRTRASDPRSQISDQQQRGKYEKKHSEIS